MANTLKQEHAEYEAHLQKMKQLVEQRDALNKDLGELENERLVRLGRMSLLREQEMAKVKPPRSRTPRAKTPPKRARARKKT
jgi:hypothetical protein